MTGSSVRIITTTMRTTITTIITAITIITTRRAGR